MVLGLHTAMVDEEASITNDSTHFVPVEIRLFVSPMLRSLMIKHSLISVTGIDEHVWRSLNMIHTVMIEKSVYLWLRHRRVPLALFEYDTYSHD